MSVKQERQLPRVIVQYAFGLFLILSSLYMAPAYSVGPSEEEIPWTGMVRVKGLESLDRLLSIAFDQKSRRCILNQDFPKEQVQNNVAPMHLFGKNFGYFSATHPLVAKVTEENEDTVFTEELLKLIHQHVSSPKQHRIAVAEALTKVLAYRDLKQGQQMMIPIMNEEGASQLIPYSVDHIFDLWHGMPAFGLMPKEPGRFAPLLLFRGTDLSLSTKRGWASVITDLNTGGPGFAVFKNAHKDLRRWLEKAAQSGQRAQVMGVSLGGVLALYTVIHENEYINHQEKYMSVAFNPPGISRKVLQKFCKGPRTKAPFCIFVTRGDLVSKIGFLIGDVREFSVKKFLRPITAHTALMCTEPVYFLSVVDVDKENESRGL